MTAGNYFFIEQLSPLYEDVQAGGIFPDSKYFVDCVPLSDPGSILRAYEEQKKEADFDLAGFVQQHFLMPPSPESSYTSAQKPLTEHLAALWDELTRQPGQQGGTLISLPAAYIVPGGRFREIYYWDSFFTMLGLKTSGRNDIIASMVDNFAYLIDTVGFIPNGNRTYYLGRSQPPFFAQIVALLADGDEAILLKYLPQVEKEYAFWMDGESLLSEKKPAHRRVVSMPDGSVMNRYWDDNDTPRPEAFTEDIHLATTSGRNAAEVYRHVRAAAESGWDFSSRWFRDGKNMSTIETTDLVPVDLNCLLVFMEVMLADLYAGKDEDKAASMKLRSIRRMQSIQKYCWDENEGFYFDYHVPDRRVTGRYSLAGVYPLFIPIAGESQCRSVANRLEEKFLQPGGLATTPYETGQQWDFPNGWAPLQWVAFQGLMQSPADLFPLAEKIRSRWTANNEKVYAETGKMMEKYNVADTSTHAGGGEYPNQDGFGWTNGVYLKMVVDQ